MQSNGEVNTYLCSRKKHTILSLVKFQIILSWLSLLKILSTFMTINRYNIILHCKKYSNTYCTISYVLVSVYALTLLKLELNSFWDIGRELCDVFGLDKKIKWVIESDFNRI